LFPLVRFWLRGAWGCPQPLPLLGWAFSFTSRILQAGMTAWQGWTLNEAQCIDV
jgi:hypothetical protein